MSTHAPTHGQRPNRLARESSPYLLQHAHNPVDWWPWGPEAIEEARRRDLPIFLSVGYSTCYWCHVMERESFEDGAIGAALADRFIAIKLDREERPDVDEVYMAAVQMLTGRGGWPMSVFLEPKSLKPFWAGTYFPPQPAHGLPSFRQVLDGLAEAWQNRRADLQKQSDSIADAVRERLGAAPRAIHIGRPQIAMAIQTLLTIFDRAHGGFGGAPKFPQPVYLALLLDVRDRIDDAATREAVDLALRTTLDKMALGGIHDQVGGGFHRYSVDQFWIVPHFEKMLYDQGQLLAVYARAAGLFSDSFYARTARRIGDYVMREMTSPDGAFFTAQDAEVDGREGLNYLWTYADLRGALPENDARFAADVYGVTHGPNFRDPHHPDEPPLNVLRLDERPEVTAKRMGISDSDLLARLDRINGTLLAARDRRKQPQLDDKVLASWNGMMISGLAVAGRVLSEPRFITAAGRAADFVLTRMRSPDGTLRRSLREGAGAVEGVLEDYAYLAEGLIELAEADVRQRSARLGQARELLEVALRRFGASNGGFYDSPSEGELFVRPRSTYDGAVPSAASVMLHALLRLGELENDPALVSRAADGLAAVSAAITESPIATANSTRALMRMLTLDEPALVGALGRADAAEPASTFPTSQPAVVQVMSSQESVQLTPDQPAELHLRLRIADGYHINAANPGDSVAAHATIPTRLHITGGTGVRVFADYPPGQPLQPADPDSPRVYTSTVEFPVALEIAGDWSGTPKLALEYQACTDTACLQPVTVLLDVEIERSP